MIGKCELCEQSEDKKCILHCEKDSSFNEYKEFNLHLKEYIGEKTVLNDIFFPPDYNYEIIFNNVSSVEFWDCTFLEINDVSEIILDNITKIHFYNCEFKEIWVHFNIQGIIYTECIFQKDLYFDRDFHNNTNEIFRINLAQCHIHGIFNLYFSSTRTESCIIKILDLTDSIFYKKVEIKDCKIENSNFTNTIFKSLTDFYKTTFNSVRFTKTSFEDVTVFTESIFNENIDFQYTTFEELVLFRETVFHKELNLIDSIIKEEANFLGIKNGDEENLKPSNVANRETARIIKYSFEKQANIIESNKFYALEMDKEEESLNWKENFKDKLIFKTHKIFSNHSQDWLLTLNWIIIFGFISALLSFFLIQNKVGEYIHFTPDANKMIVLFIMNLLFLILVTYKEKVILFKIMPFFMYIFYSCLTNDIFLKHFATTFNPLFIMKNGINITFPELLVKLIIAYLIYQFIISIRQNTRRQ